MPLREDPRVSGLPMTTEESVPDGDDTVAGTSHGAGGDETEVVPPVTEGVPELAWSHDLGDDDTVWDYPTAPPWGKARQRVTDFFHPYADETPIDDDQDEDDDDEPIEIPDASWRASFAAASPLLFVLAFVAFIGMCALAASVTQPQQQSAPASHNTTPAVSTTPIAAFTPAFTTPVAATPPLDVPPVAAPPPTVTVPPPPPSTVTVQAAPAPAPPAAPPRDADQVFREGVSGIPGIRIINWDVAEAGARSICGGFAHGMSRAQVIDSVQRNDPTFTPWQTSGMVNVALAAYCPQYEGN